MKFVFCILLALVIPFSSVSRPATVPVETPVSENEAGFPEMSEISARQIDDDHWIQKSFALGNDFLALSLSLPDDWKFSRTGTESYRILRKGKEIGAIGTTAPAKIREMQFVDWIENDDLYCDYSLIRIGEKDGDIRRLFTALYSCYGIQRLLYLNVDPTELDEDACAHILWEIGICPTITPLPERAGEPLSIMIFGNSFVRTSEIGDQLRHMIEESGEECAVDAVSISSATMSYLAYNTLTQQHVKNIRDGKYNIVFQCGFYYDDDLNAFRTLQQACAESGTRLIIFPAYNERQPVLDKAFAAFPEVRVLNWRQEIYGLIDTGISQWDFCINDSYRHSKPLAGYVGAHMIYRMIFGKLPQPVISERPLTMTYIKSLLLDYPETGVVPGMQTTDVLLID